MNYQKLLEQHKETVYKMILRRKPALYHPPRIEPIPSGNLPAGFNLSTDRSVYIENIHTQVTEPMIHEVFSSIGPVETCKLIRKEKSSYGFIQYHDRRSPALAIFTLNGRHLYGQPLKVNWAYTSAQREDTSEDGKEATNNDAPENSSQFATGSSEDGKEAANNDASENKPQFTTVYVGHLAPEVTQLDLHRHFHNLCVGVIEEVQVHRNKGFGFVRYSKHGQAKLAIKMANNQPFLFGKRIKCSWGNKPTPPGTRSTPLLPPAPAGLPDLSTFLAYERQLAKSKMGGFHPLHSQGQLPLPLKQASMGMGAAGANQAIYDDGEFWWTRRFK